MALVVTNGSSVPTYSIGAGKSRYGSALLFQKRRTQPNNKGTVIQIGSASFRKATDHTHVSITYQPEAAQYTPFQYLSGGQWVDRVHESNPGHMYHYLYANNMGMRNVDGKFIVCNSLPVDLAEGQRNEAVTKALNALADQKVNLGENLATMGQTARMFATNAKSLADLLRAMFIRRELRPYLRRTLRSLKNDKNVPRRITDKYLEYVYGWLPLMNDVYSGYKLLKENDPESLLLSAKGVSRRQYGLTNGSHHHDGSPEITIDLVHGEESSVARCILHARLDPNWQGGRTLNQLGLLNPVSLAWELVPWSFVVDWVLPIGPVLSALTAPAGLLFVDGSIGHKDVSVMKWEAYRAKADSWEYRGLSNPSPATGTIFKRSYNRSALAGWPAPGFWFDPDPLRGDRIFKAGALAISNLRGPRNSVR